MCKWERDVWWWQTLKMIDILTMTRHFGRLGLGFNQIKFVENGSLNSIPNVREIHLDNNRLKKVPPGLSALRYLQVSYRHSNGRLRCKRVFILSSTKIRQTGHLEVRLSPTEHDLSFQPLLTCNTLQDTQPPVWQIKLNTWCCNFSTAWYRKITHRDLIFHDSPRRICLLSEAVSFPPHRLDICDGKW